MQNHRSASRLLLVLTSVFLTSCASTQAPRGWLPDVEQAAAHPYGAWVEIKTRNRELLGELIALSEDTVFIADSNFHAVPSSAILSAMLKTYDETSLVPAVLLGTLSTVSHGYGLVITLPFWLIFGSASAASRSYDPIIEYPDKPLSDFIPFARYPQGLPKGLDRKMITMKPLHDELDE